MKTFVIILIGSLCMMAYCSVSPMKKLPLVPSNADIICPDAVTLCHQGDACCATAGGDYFCCPFPQSICCSDTRSCCPSGSKCDSKSLSCLPV